MDERRGVRKRRITTQLSSTVSNHKNQRKWLKQKICPCDGANVAFRADFLVCMTPFTIRIKFYGK